jgi:uncharacterized protein
MTEKAPPLQPQTALEKCPPICGDFGIAILRDGTWTYQGSPISRLPLVKLFASVLRRVEDEYWLVTPVERGRIAVEDVPFLAVELTATGDGPDQALTFRTNLDEIVTLDANHPLWVTEAPDTGEPQPYILVKPGLAARLVRSVFYHLVDLAIADATGRLGVWSHGSFFPLQHSGQQEQ